MHRPSPPPHPIHLMALWSELPEFTTFNPSGLPLPLRFRGFGWRGRICQLVSILWWVLQQTAKECFVVSVPAPWPATPWLNPGQGGDLVLGLDLDLHTEWRGHLCGLGRISARWLAVLNRWSACPPGAARFLPSASLQSTCLSSEVGTPHAPVPAVFPAQLFVLCYFSGFQVPFYLGVSRQR